MPDETNEDDGLWNWGAPRRKRLIRSSQMSETNPHVQMPPVTAKEMLLATFIIKDYLEHEHPDLSPDRNKSAIDSMATDFLKHIKPKLKDVKL